MASAAALLAAGVGLAAGPAAVAAPQASPGGVTTLTGTLADGATYEIQVPGTWNGTVFLYSHGYVAPGSANPAADVGDRSGHGRHVQHTTLRTTTRKD